MTTTIDLNNHETRLKALESKITALEARRVPRIRMERYVLSWEGKGDSDNWFGHAGNDKVQDIPSDAFSNGIVDGYNTGVSTDVNNGGYNQAMMSWAWKTHNRDGSRFMDNHNLQLPGNFCTVYAKNGTWRVAIDASEVDDVWDVWVLFLNV